MKKLLAILIVLAFIPLASADIIVPGMHSVNVNNQITNANDFPDYVFISYGMTMCPPKIVENGKIASDYYKLCSLSVYAINKADFNESYFRSLGEKGSNALDYVSSLPSKEVIREVITETSLKISDPRTEILNYYSIDINAAKDKPDNTSAKIDYWGFLFILIPFALVLLIEGLIVFAFLNKKENIGKICLYVFLINLVSWPIANYVLSDYIGFLLTEAIVILAESAAIMLLFKLKYPKSLLISLAANAVSAIIGLIIQFVGI